MTRLLVALITLGLYAALAAYSYGKHVSREWHRTPMSEGEFVARKLAEYDSSKVRDYRPSKIVYIWRDKKAAQIAEALSLTPESIDTTVDVRRMP